MTAYSLIDENGVARWHGTIEPAPGGAVSAPLVLTGTDPAEPVLDLHADDAQTEHILRVYDLNGDLAVDIDFEGILDTRHVVVQDPPDTGGGEGASATNLAPAQININSGDDTALDPFYIDKWVPNVDPGLRGWRRPLRIKRGDSEIIELNPIANEVGITVVAPETPTGNAIELWDHPFNSLLFAVGYDGTVTSSVGTQRELLGGTPVTIADSAAALLPWGHFSGTALLDLTDPTTPTVVEAGVYAISLSVSVAPTDSVTVGGGFGAYLEVDSAGDDAVLNALSGPATAVLTQPRLTFSMTYYIPAGGTLNVQATNFDGASSRDFVLSEAVVQRLS